MGLFDFLKSRQQREREAAAEALMQLVQAVSGMGAGGVDADRLPQGRGAFGVCVTNPVPTASVIGSSGYLSRLRLGGAPVTATRIGSTRAKEITDGMIDMYRIDQNGQSTGITLFLCPYHRRNSGEAPQGFLLA